MCRIEDINVYMMSISALDLHSNISVDEINEGLSLLVPTYLTPSVATLSLFSFTYFIFVLLFD